MSKLIIPTYYERLLDMKQTEQGIKQIKDFFQMNLSTELRLRRVTAPLFVLKGLGINDDLNGVERAVTFPIKDLGDAKAEVVHSLAKWKRLTLAEYEVEPGYGVYADMNAIRADEELDNLHSLYVDQWDWEAVITREDRNLDFLKRVVRRIYAAILRTEYLTCETYNQIKPFLPRDIHFIHSEDLLAMKKETEQIYVKDVVLDYIVTLCEKTRIHPGIIQGSSPRGSLALTALARAVAWLQGRDYVLPRDVRFVYHDCIDHRLIWSQDVAPSGHTEILEAIMKAVKAPAIQ